MASPRGVYICQECGYGSASWLGRCPECGTWNSFVEEAPAAGAAPGTRAPRGGEVLPLSSVPLEGGLRLPTGLGELDRVLGGGLVPGSVVLVGGEPGIGKTTLLLQAAARLAGSGRRVLYVTGEESLPQVRLRAERLGTAREDVLALAETGLEAILAAVAEAGPEVVVVDSVQAVESARIPSPPGTIAQVREAAAALISLAKAGGPAVFLVGHVTKEGSLAGPKVLEHMVDTVVYFEGDPVHLCRVLRASKNRFGSSSEVGVFQMGDEGLREVENPSALFLGGRREPQPGTAVVPSLEGRRPILVEVQALVSHSGYSSGRRSVSGLDTGRVTMLLAVLEKRGGLSFAQSDVYASAAGGLRLVEPAADLAVLLALASSHRNTPVDARTAVFGEVGLTGEVRGVTGEEARLREAAKMGFVRCILPEATSDGHARTPSGLELLRVGRIEQALSAVDL